MINIDLSKTPSLRFFVYLLALIPGLFFLVSIALGNPLLAEGLIKEVGHLYPVPPYLALFLSLGSAFVIGQAFVLSSWLLAWLLTTLIRLPKAVFRKVFGANWLYRWWGKHQAIPPKRTALFVRTLRGLNMFARKVDADPADARLVRMCLGVAVEKLLERRYGIDPHRAGGPNGEWGVWYSVLGKPPKQLGENLNAGRTTLATGLAGFCAIGIAPSLLQRYFIAMCALFALCGLWTALAHFFTFRNSANLDVWRLRAVLLELQELPSESKARENQADGE